MGEMGTERQRGIGREREKRERERGERDREREERDRERTPL